MNNKITKERYSGVELLRIIAIFLICVSHAVQTSKDFVDFNVTFSFINLILRILRYSGQIGNILFVICSAWFLIDSKKTKWNKVFTILFDSMLISIFIMLCFIVGGYQFSAQTIVKQIFPDIFKNVWFVPIYVIFYIFHPVYNWVIDKMSEQVHFVVMIFLLCVLGVANIFFESPLQLYPFIAIYFIVAYFKKYHTEFCNNKKMNIIVFILSSLMFLLLVSSVYLFKLTDATTLQVSLDVMYSVTIFPAMFCLFNLFRNMKFKSKFINYAASCSLFVYCIHENILLRSIIRPQYYSWAIRINASVWFGWIMLCAIGMFIIAYLLAILYKNTIHRGTSWIADKLALLLNRVWQKATKK